eukprot:1328634-Amorphochlora_amoeboformis.AAC.1
MLTRISSESTHGSHGCTQQGPQQSEILREVTQLTPMSIPASLSHWLCRGEIMAANAPCY